MSLTAGTRLGHYHVSALIGEGGVGQVWHSASTRRLMDVRREVTMLYSGHVFEFRSELEPEQLEQPLNDAGPFEWRAFDNDAEGAYLVCYPDGYSDIKLRGRAPELNMTIEFICEEPDKAAEFEASKVRVLAAVRERLLPAAGASDVREDAG